MHSIWFTTVATTLTIIGLVLLVKSTTALLVIHSTGVRIEQSAQSPAFKFDLTERGIYQISIKRSSIFGVISNNNSFQVNDLTANKTIALQRYTFLLSGSTDMSGNRVVPVAEFTIDQPGSFQLLNPATTNYNESDKLLIASKPGFRGVLLIIATVFSGILFIGGLIFSILSLVKN